LFFLFFPNIILAEDEKIWAIPELQVKISDELTEKLKEKPKCFTNSQGNEVCEINWLNTYISEIYKYAIGVGGILAAMMIMIGSTKWLMAAGNSASISEAQSWVVGAVTGVVLLLSSYLILYQINPDLVLFKPFRIGSVEKVSLADIKEKFTSMSMPSKEEMKGGFTAFVTGYCQPKASDFKTRKDFLCAVGLNCSCPGGLPGRDVKGTCGPNSNGFSWSSCLDFNENTTKYCHQTASGGMPQEGQVAADWTYFPKLSKVCIGGITYTVTDQGSAIKGRRFDIWQNSCSNARKITGSYSVKKGECKDDFYNEDVDLNL